MSLCADFQDTHGNGDQLKSIERLLTVNDAADSQIRITSEGSTYLDDLDNTHEDQVENHLEVSKGE